MHFATNYKVSGLIKNYNRTNENKQKKNCIVVKWKKIN